MYTTGVLYPHCMHVSSSIGTASENDRENEEANDDLPVSPISSRRSFRDVGVDRQV